MRIFSIKPGHDGHIAYAEDGKLIFSIEAEKDSGYRYASLDAIDTIKILNLLPSVPDIIAISGWSKGAKPTGKAIAAGYMGNHKKLVWDQSIFGKNVKMFSSSHERSHILSAYALSPFPQGQPCYALVWEGFIGSFYKIDEHVNIEKLTDVMTAPGVRYAFAYGLADPSFSLPAGQIRLSDAGKLMALSAYTEPGIYSDEESEIIARIFSDPSSSPQLNKNDFRRYAIFNSGVESHHAKRLASIVSSEIMSRFAKSIRPLATENLPLLISGGCGLNCDWNRQWRDSGIFSDVFVPPCSNDSGSGIGTAADAQLHFYGQAKFKWDVYCGPAFVDDMNGQEVESLGQFNWVTSDVEVIASLLAKGAVLGWVSGNAEMGPRSLGNRSIIAQPFSRDMLQRLNSIKKREQFRPISPICLAEDAARYFDTTAPSPHMLYLARVSSDALQAVTHVDGSARVQTVEYDENPSIHSLLRAFRKCTGFGVLCNTSLNFNGMGFINRTSDLVEYATQCGLDGFVIEGKAFLRNSFIH